MIPIFILRLLILCLWLPSMRFYFHCRHYKSTSLNPTTWKSGKLDYFERPPIIYLSDLTDTSKFTELQLKELPNWCEMPIDTNDRSTFSELAQGVIEKVTHFNHKVLIVGEGFGGLLLSTYVASRCASSEIAALVLINPVSAGSSKDMTRQQSSLPGRFKNAHLTKEAIRWRWEHWYEVGRYIMDNRYVNITTPVLILSNKNKKGKADEVKKLFKNAFVRIRPLEECCSLEHLDQLITNSSITSYQKEQQDGGDEYVVSHPTPADLEDIRPVLDALFRSTSPIFLSKTASVVMTLPVAHTPASDDDTEQNINISSNTDIKSSSSNSAPQHNRLIVSKSMVRGLGPVPTGSQGRPVLLVGNHQLLGADVPMILAQFLREKHTLVRGMAHPFIFRGEGESVRETAELATRFGGVEVSPMSLYRLLRMNETVMLFPGGASEAFHSKGEEYKLFWPEKSEFVRMAALTDAIVVPFAAIGMADSIRILADGNDVRRKTPWLWRRFEGLSARMPQARAGLVEAAFPPLVSPRLPARNYFLFQEPFDTRTLAGGGSKAECRAAYQQIRAQVEKGIETLKRFRARDKYRDFIPRILYEKTHSNQAPTAPVILELYEN